MITRQLGRFWAVNRDLSALRFLSGLPVHCRLISTQHSNMDTEKAEETTEIAASRRRYEDCIKRLNSLQTPMEVMQRLRKEGKIKERLNSPNITEMMLGYLERCGISIDQIDQLPVIHVTGSKGKGSVCAFCETILRKYNLKTGLLTSPHLVEVRERVRLNGRPMSYNKYCRYFIEVFDKLEGSKGECGGSDDQSMPLYNRMQAVLAFYTFIKEKVDVAVIEVGCGGQYDYTNFVRVPTVAGITSLALEHRRTLGDTIESIAWHKAGILKPARPAFTVPQPVEGMEVIVKRAAEIGTTIQCIPELDEPIQIGLAGSHQRLNASLAVQLCQRFLEERKLVSSFNPTDSPPPLKKSKHDMESGLGQLTDGSDLGMTSADPFVLPEEFIAGLRDCYWPGRTQTITRDNVTYYLDCAHTIESIEHCMEWFTEASRKEKIATKGKIIKILLFNMKLSKYNPSLLRPLVNGDFDAAVFCPSVIDQEGNPPESTFVYHADADQRQKSQSIKELFELLQRSRTSLPPDNTNTNNCTAPSIDNAKETSAIPSDVENRIPRQERAYKCHWLPSISGALYWATAGRDPNLRPPKGAGVPPIEEVKHAERIQVLVTGSVYLVGGVIRLLDPNLASK